MRRKFNLLLTACAVATLGLGAIAFTACDGENPSGGVKPHDHVWGDYTITREATCTQTGERVQHCLVTGCDATTEPEVIAMKPHQFGPEMNTATCGKAGNRVQECKVCGYQKVGEATEALEHEFVLDQVVKEATCKEDGIGTYKCKNCQEVQENVPIAKIPHNWVKNPNKSKKATCEKPGLDYMDCINENCGEHQENIVEALGHQPDPTTYDYKFPTFSEPGYRKGKCTVCGKSLDDDLPKLEEGALTEFQFKVLRTTGKVLTTYSMKITITDWEGKEVATAEDKDLKKGVFYVKLPAHQGKKYKMSATGLTGYESGTVEVDPEQPIGELKVKALGLYEIGAANVPSKLGQGNLAQDFELQDINGKTVHLKDLVQNNKLVMLKFFRTECPWCDTEFPGFVTAYNKYKDQGVAAVGLAPATSGWPNNLDVEAIKFKADKFHMSFPVIQDKGTNGRFIYERYNGIDGAPSTVFIDHEGVIVKIQLGYLSKDGDRSGAKTAEAYEDIFKEYINDNWEDPNQTIAPEHEVCDYILPRRQDEE